MRKYHHLGIPTGVPQPGETYLEGYKCYCTDHEGNPFGIQWMRYEPDCSLPDLVKTVPHVAFEVDDLESELAGQEVIIEPNSPSAGVLVAFVVCQGAPVEFLQLDSSTLRTSRCYSGTNADKRPEHSLPRAPACRRKKVIMVQYYMRVGTFMVGVAVACGAMAQNSRMISIDPSGESTRVYLSYVDATAEDNFARLFEIPRYQDYKPYALLLTNNSGKAIVSLTIRWIGTSAGKSGVFDSSSDSLLSGAPAGGSSMMMLQRPIPGQTQVQLGQSCQSANGPEVIANGERMLVAPGLFARESVAMQRGTAGGSASMPKALQSAEAVSATLDAVVLEDGEVLGPDASHTVDGLLSGKAAIDGVVSAVRAAEQSGQDGVEALRQLANAQPTRDQSPVVRQQGTIARVLMSSRQWREQLEKLAALQLPRFYR